MKRESISPDEAQLNDDALLPFIDDMLKARKLAFDEINEKYGLDIKVTLDSSWLKEQEKQNTDVTASPQTIADNDILASPDPEDDQGPDSQTEVPEETSESPEDIKEETEEASQVLEEIKENIEEIKEDIQEVKEDLDDGNEDTETE